MPSPSVTYTFSNSTTADGPQVSTNFTNLISAMTDGTADFHIGALNVEGACTFDGAVTLGDALSDDITFIGAIASTIPWKTNALYNLGSATLAPLSIYLGNGTKSTRLLAGTVGTSYTITLPDNVSALGQHIIFNASGVAAFRYEDKFTASKTTDYTATGDETIIPCAPAASMTVTLPAASTMTGKSLTIKKTDSDFSKTVTIDGNAAETIDGAATYVLYTQYESVTIKCDGSNWHVEQHHSSTPWTTYTWAVTGSVSNPTVATTNTKQAMWRRVGDSVWVRIYYSHSNAAGSALGSGSYLFTLPAFTIESTLVPISTTYNSANGVGYSSFNVGSSVYQGLHVQVYDATRLAIGYVQNAAAFLGSATAGWTNATFQVFIDAKMPVTGWKP